MHKVENWNFSNRRNELSRLYLDSGYTGNRCPLWVILSGNLKKRAAYWRHDNTALPDNMKYNIQ